jgi:hypothetical protein
MDSVLRGHECPRHTASWSGNSGHGVGLRPGESNPESRGTLLPREVTVGLHHRPCEVRAGGICGSGIVEVQSKEPRPTPPSGVLVLLGLLAREVSN